MVTSLKSRVRHIRKVCTSIICILAIISNPLASLATTGDVSDHGADAGGSGAVSGGKYTWNQTKSGYRLVIINKEFKCVSNTVDLLYSDPIMNDYGGSDGMKDRYTSTRAGNGKGYKSIQLLALMKSGTIDQMPEEPIRIVGTKALPSGEQFKSWFLKGQNGITYVPEYSGGGGVYIPPEGGGGETLHPELPTPEKPVKVPELPAEKVEVKDLPTVSKVGIIYNDNYRITAYDKATDYVMGNMIYDLDKDGSNIDSLRSLVNIKDSNGDSRYSESQIAEALWKRVCKQSSTNAERVYYYTSAWSKEFPIDYNPTAKKEKGSKGKKTGAIIIGKDLLMQPMAPGCDGSNGYADEILNGKYNGVFIFNVDGVGQNGKTVIDVMRDNDYSVLVEPIFWLVPAAYSKTTKIGRPIHTNYVYGTIAEHIKFHVGQGLKFGSTGGAYSTVISKLGWSTMFTNKDWPEESNPIIKKYGATGSMTERKNIGVLDGWINGAVGIGMHIYKVAGGDPVLPTFDTKEGNTPHKAPDPKDLPNPLGDTKRYKVVKYYETVNEKDEVISSSKYTRQLAPPKIDIQDEVTYEVESWFISKNLSSGEPEYRKSRNSLPVSRHGNSTGIVQFDKNVGELTLHLLLRKIVIEIPPKGYRIEESEISKSFETLRELGPRVFTFSCANMDGSHSWTTKTGKAPDVTTHHHSCHATWGDNSYSYIIEYTHDIDDQIEANFAGGVFKAKMTENKKAGTVSKGGGTKTIPNSTYKTVLWRGLDIPTIAKYKENNTNKLISLLKEYSIIPIMGRYKNGYYKTDVKIQTAVDESGSDLRTHTEHSTCGGTYKSSKHKFNKVAEYEQDITVMVWRGDRLKDTGSETTADKLRISKNNSGYMVQGNRLLKFYPYINMTYQKVGQDKETKTDVKILSQYESKLLPNDFAEAAWKNSDSENAVLVESAQWSIHARAVNGNGDWAGVNKVLPGGALYTLKVDKPADVAVTTWQTVIEGKEREALSEDIGVEYSESEAIYAHAKFADSVEKTLDSTKLVQWVSKKHGNKEPFKSGILVEGKGESLSKIGLSGKTSTEEKYYLREKKYPEGMDEKRKKKLEAEDVSRPDLDILGRKEENDIAYKVFSDYKGNIYLAVGNSVDDLEGINGENLSGAEKILNKSQGASGLKGDAKEIDLRTKLITNFVASIERNTGKDKTASWALKDGKWYNEAWDGISVLKQTTVFRVGMQKPDSRVTVLDPKLCYKTKSKKDMFTGANKSRYGIDNRTEGKPDNFIGEFRGKDIELENMSGMIRSDAFFIPNYNVQSNL